MKILQVISYFNPKFGGDVNVCTNLSKILAKRNHDVTIITTDFGFDSRYADDIRAHHVTVIPFPCLANYGLFLYSPSIKIWLKTNLKEFDIIHIHNFRSYESIVVSIFAIRYGISYIVQAHGSVLPFFEKTFLKRLYDQVWGNKILANASKMIAVSKIEKDQYKKMEVPESKIKIIPNGINTYEYSRLPERGIFRKKYGIAADEKIILYLGRLHKRKGLDFLITGFLRLLDLDKDVKLIIAGPDDGFLEILVQQIKKVKIDQNILIVGPVSHEEKNQAFADADLLVYPGISEIFGLVPFEAIMCGTPVIVADDCGCGEIIKEADCGYLVPIGDVSGLCSMMGEILENPDAGKEKVIRGQQYIKAHLSWDTTILKFEELYEDCLRNL